MKFYFNGKLLEALSSGPGTKESAEGKRSQIDPVNLNLVLDVQLNMSLRFGQRQLPLREVLELASGSVVELDRQVDDPVELLLDGRVIARGEAVIVDGNYGLRVTEITEPIASNFVR
jgi:flagellar motor switch protein FliN/FliY